MQIKGRNPHELRPFGFCLQNFEHASRTHAAANAHGHAYALGTATLTFNQGVARQTLAGNTIGVAQRNRATVDVEAISRNAQLVAAVEDLTVLSINCVIRSNPVNREYNSVAVV